LKGQSLKRADGRDFAFRMDFKPTIVDVTYHRGKEIYLKKAFPAGF